MRKNLLLLVGIAACGSVISFAGPVYPNPGTVAPSYTFTAATSGEEVGYFYGSTALDYDAIGVWVNGTQLGQWAFDDQTANFGDMVDFGAVKAGDTIVFALADGTRGYQVYSDASMNPDGINHVYTTAFAGQTLNNVTIPAGTFVGFEDLLYPWSDLNYNDDTAVFSDLAADPVASTTPEPASLLLLGLGLAGTALGLGRRKPA